MVWPDFQYDQTNLAKLCAERQVVVTEYHIQNQLYGLATLLREYADLKEDEPFPWAMEHAISFENPEPYSADAASRLPIILAISEQQAEVLKAHVQARVLAIGSAYFYMRELMRRRGKPRPFPGRRGTLVFPDKSTTFKDTDFDRDRFAADLAALPDDYQPVYVSVFWKDYQRGTHAPFERAGLNVVSSGHPYDPEFLFRQYDMCRQFKYACANDLSTSFCLSVLAGCKFFYLPTGRLQVVERGELRIYDEEPTIHLAGKQACLGASRFPPTNNDAEQRKLAERFAGLSSVQPPEFFQELDIEGRRLLRTAPVPSANFSNGQERDSWGGWMLRGVDMDGWARGSCELEIPAHSHYAGVRIRLALPLGALDDGPREFAVTVDGSSKAIRLGRHSLLLDIDCHVDASRRVKLQCDKALPIEGGRQRAFQILRIAWQDSFSMLTLRRRVRIRN